MNGQILALTELYNHHIRVRPFWPPLILSQVEYAGIDFHPLGVGQDGWKLWVQYFSTTCQILSGHTPSKEEIKIIREFIRRLPNEFKRRHVDHRFVICFVSYLFIGFKGHVQTGFNHDSSAIDALVEFTLSLYASDRVLFTSFLCAHRDPQPKQGEPLNLLQSCIPPEKIRRAASLVLALAHNASDSIHGSVIFLQQKASFAATSSIFPEVSVEYFLSARAHEMLQRLTYQYELVQSTLKSLPGKRVSPHLVSLDTLTKRIERFLRERYGANWRYRDFTDCANFTDCSNESDPIIQIAIHMALPDIARMMPFFSGDFQQHFLSKKAEILRINREMAIHHSNLEMASRVTQMIEWFMQQHSMTISAKAVYETTFYYLWGRYCGMYHGAFAIGFDRDHDRFQHFAWQQGYSSVAMDGQRRLMIPLYARRNPKGLKYGSLADLSFRQFWRYEA
ncbi:MAG: hypothetical protein AAB400_03940 [Patescibacteria group bacterium]